MEKSSLITEFISGILISFVMIPESIAFAYLLDLPASVGICSIDLWYKPSIFICKHSIHIKIIMSEYFDNKNTFMAPNVSQHGAHMVMTNVMKPTKLKYLNLDTKFCDEYVNNRTNPTNPNYNLASYTCTWPERITDVTSMKVENIQIPMTFYNISAALDNNYFSVSWASTATYNASITYTNSIIIVIPDGVYDAPGIATAINTQLSNNTTLNTKLTYVQSGNTSNFYAATGSNNLQFKIDFAVSTTGSFDKFNVKSKLGWILGYRNITYTIKPNSGQSVGSVSEAYINLFTNKYF